MSELESIATGLAKESKIELMHRLEREGRWRGPVAWAEETKDVYIKTCRAKEKKEKRPPDAGVPDEAWEMLRALYPPMAPEEVEAAKKETVGKQLSARQEVSARATEKAVVKAIEKVEAEVEDLPLSWKIPGSWGELPATASYRAEVEWVHGQRVDILEERAGKQPKVNLKKATRPAPSKGALGLLQDYIRGPQKFMEIAYKVLGGGESEDGEAVKREKRSLKEIEAILERMEAAT